MCDYCFNHFKRKNEYSAKCQKEYLWVPKITITNFFPFYIYIFQIQRSIYYSYNRKITVLKTSVTNFQNIMLRTFSFPLSQLIFKFFFANKLVRLLLKMFKLVCHVTIINQGRNAPLALCPFKKGRKNIGLKFIGILYYK